MLRCSKFVLQKSVWLGLEMLCELRGPFSQYHLSEGRRWKTTTNGKLPECLMIRTALFKRIPFPMPQCVQTLILHPPGLCGVFQTGAWTRFQDVSQPAAWKLEGMLTAALAEVLTQGFLQRMLRPGMFSCSAFHPLRFPNVNIVNIALLALHNSAKMF